MKATIVTTVFFCLSWVFLSTASATESSFEVRNPTNEALPLYLDCGIGNERAVVLNPGETKTVEASGCVRSAGAVTVFWKDSNGNAPTGIAYPVVGKKYVLYKGWTQTRSLDYLEEDNGQTPGCWFQYRGTIARSQDGSCPQL